MDIRTCLIVDDSRIIRKVARRIVEGLGFEVDEAADGADRPGERYVVDSWFVDNGEPAVVLPLAEWLKGGGPNVQ